MSRAEEDEPVDRRLLLSLQHIQERNILMNQALFRQRLAQEDSIKEAEEDEDEEERDDEEEEEEEGERNNNCKGGAGLYVNGRGSWSSSHTPSSSSLHCKIDKEKHCCHIAKLLNQNIGIC